ncbi:hypothetical protein B0H19DRAFT_1245858 [Mycena capillaripes]|nr:hypothetical protein B0H19DRAFT_1245858 [Mycena capillaripes]
MNNSSFTTIDPVLRPTGLDSTDPTLVVVTVRRHIHTPPGLDSTSRVLIVVNVRLHIHIPRNLARVSTHIRANANVAPLPVHNGDDIIVPDHVADSEGEIIPHVGHNQREIVHPDHNPHGLGNIVVFTILIHFEGNTRFRGARIIDSAPAMDWECVFIGVGFILVGFLLARIFARVVDLL